MPCYQAMTITHAVLADRWERCEVDSVIGPSFQPQLDSPRGFLLGLSQPAFCPAPDDMKMPVPEASLVVVKAMHPCTVALLRSKLSRTLDIPLEEVRYNGRGFFIVASLVLRVRTTDWDHQTV